MRHRLRRRPPCKATRPAGDTVSAETKRCAYAPAVRDWLRFSDAWAHRPDLRDGFREGYGRPLTGLEEEHLAAEAVLDAVSGIAYGTAQADPEVAERGRRTLQRLRTAQRDAPPA
ncbi:hypothetical protein [Streptomyces sp. NPDC090445]|uniref:hypothetical protein n=1 Tax=Streptomyces sp. NPDC090445 TaxID=3365963 RepID=UPI0037F1970B